MMRTKSLNSACVLGLVASLAMVGCSSTRTVVTKPQPRQPDHSVVVDEPGGPPPHAPAHGYRRKHQFIYYPSANVYYDTEAERYFWVEGGQWVIGVRLPKRIVLETGSAQTVSLDPNRPFDEHKHAAASDGEKNQPHGKAVGHTAAHGKARGKGRQTASAVGDSP